jgi:hypothetical protein
MQEKFNQSKYIQQFKKEHYKQFKVDLKQEEWDEIDKLLKDNNITKAEFLRISITALKKGTLKKDL